MSFFRNVFAKKLIAISAGYVLLSSCSGSSTADVVCFRSYGSAMNTELQLFFKKNLNFIILLLIVNGTAYAMDCPSNSSELVRLEFQKMNDALYDIRSGGSKSELDNAMKFSSCATRLTQEQKLQILKDNFIDMNGKWFSSYKDGPAQLKKTLEEFSPIGKEFVAQATSIFDPKTTTDVQIELLVKMNPSDAERIVTDMISREVGSRNSSDPDKLKVDFEKLQSLALKFVNDPTQLVSLLANNDYIDRTPLLAAKTMYELNRLENLNPTLEQICSLVRSSMYAFNYFLPNSPRVQIQIDLLRRSKMLIDSYNKPDQKCQNSSIADLKAMYDKAWMEKGADWGLGSTKVPPKKTPQLIKQPVYQNGECFLEDIQKWIQDTAKYKYQWPNHYFGAEEIKKSCRIELWLQSETVKVTDPRTKKRKTEKQVKIKLRGNDPSASKQSELTVPLERLQFSLYSEILNWGVFKSKFEPRQKNEVAPTDRHAVQPSRR